MLINKATLDKMFDHFGAMFRTAYAAPSMPQATGETLDNLTQQLYGITRRAEETDDQLRARVQRVWNATSPDLVVDRLVGMSKREYLQMQREGKLPLSAPSFLELQEELARAGLPTVWDVTERERRRAKELHDKARAEAWREGVR